MPLLCNKIFVNFIVLDFNAVKGLAGVDLKKIKINSAGPLDLTFL